MRIYQIDDNGRWYTNESRIVLKGKEAESCFLEMAEKSLNDKYINEACIGKFLTEWIKLERMLEDFSLRFGSDNMYRTRDAISKLSRCIDFPQSILQEYWGLKKIRNMLVHGVEIPTDQDLLLYADRIIAVKNEIEFFFDKIGGNEN